MYVRTIILSLNLNWSEIFLNEYYVRSIFLYLNDEAAANLCDRVSKLKLILNDKNFANQDEFRDLIFKNTRELQEIRDNIAEGVFKFLIIMNLNDPEAITMFDTVINTLTQLKFSPLMSEINTYIIPVFLTEILPIIPQEKKSLISGLLSNLINNKLYSFAVFVSNQNYNEMYNKKGFTNLNEHELKTLLGEIISSLTYPPDIVDLLIRDTTSLRAYFASIGSSSLIFYYDNLITNKKIQHSTELIERILTTKDLSRSNNFAREFWKELNIGFENLYSNLKHSEELKKIYQLFRFDPKIWTFTGKSILEKLGLELIRFLSATPQKIYLYAIYLLDLKLKEIYSIADLKANLIQKSVSEKLQNGFASASETLTPQEIKSLIQDLRENIQQQILELKNQQNKPENIIEIEEGKVKFEHVIAEEPDLDYYYNDIVESIKHRPLPVAMWSRYLYLGIISGFLIDLIIYKTPKFVFNLGFLATPGVPVLLTFAIFFLFALLRYIRYNSRLKKAIKFFIASVKFIANKRIKEHLISKIYNLYQFTLQTLQKFENHTDLIMNNLEIIKEELEPVNTLQSTLFKHSLIEKLNYNPEQLFEYNYQSQPLNWNTEIRDFLTLGLLRKILLSNSPEDNNLWTELKNELLKFSQRGYQHIKDISSVQLLNQNTQNDNIKIIEEMEKLSFPPFPVKFNNTNVLLKKYLMASEQININLSEKNIEFFQINEKDIIKLISYTIFNYNNSPLLTEFYQKSYHDQDENKIEKQDIL